MARKKTNEVEETNAGVAASINFDNPEDVVPIEDDIPSDSYLEPPVFEQEQEVEESKPRPKMHDPEWTQWVLDQLMENELEQGLPKVNGLRRITRKLMGPILKSYPDTKQVPTIENSQRATVEYRVVVLNRYLLEEGEEPYILEFGDVADAYHGNIKGIEYARFPPQMASTRAESRALRKLLCLDVVASEEISDQPLEEAGFDGKISESQITKIDIKCHQLDIDVIKFINMGKTKYRSINDVSSLTAVKMFGLINEYQQKVRAIPDNIKGYSPNWRGDF